MVFGVRHTNHGAHIVLAKRMEEVGEIFPLVIESRVGGGGNGIVVAVGHRGEPERT